MTSTLESFLLSMVSGLSARLPHSILIPSRSAVPFGLMHLWRLAALGACVPWLPHLGAESPGLLTTSAGSEIGRSAPRLFLDSGEGFTPRSANAGIEWSGKLSILRSGMYRFFAAPGSLRVGEIPVGDAAVRLDAGRHEFVLRQPRTPGPIAMGVDWEGPGFPREPIPPRLFSHGDAAASSTGRALFEDLGCSNCHLSESPSIQQRPAPVLTGLGGRVRTEWIRHWLDAPERFRPWATMPQTLSDEERADVAAYLAMQGLPATEEPDFSGSHIERGRTTFQSFGCGACHSAELPLDGLGSKMTVGRLQSYLLDPIQFSPDGRMPSFHLTPAEALELAAYLAQSRNEAFEQPARLGDPRRGGELVRTAGCIACHQLSGLEPDVQAPRLDTLDETTGCLGNAVPSGLPRYRLTVSQRDSLRRFVAGYRVAPDTAPSPTFDLVRRLRQLRCGACHEIDGAPSTGWLAETAPPLTGVGEKLKSSWIEQAIGSKTKALGWQELRMPGFGASQARWLADALSKASGVNPGELEPEVSAGLAETGHNRLGVDGSTGGMGCIGCHGWGDLPSLGENGPELSTAGRRLRWAWFKRWMRDPARILAGTSMPSYFGGSESPESVTAINALWSAFQTASERPPPFGFRPEDASQGGEGKPVPVDRAIVVRWDMPEATPAAIAVGLPGGISYCFDAGESKLRYAWSGGFVDMSRTLLNKKNRQTNLTETAEIVGKIFFREGLYPIRVGDRDRVPQTRFRGYRLVDSIPEFHYQVDGISVYERIEPADSGLVRRFRIVDVRQPMWFVPAESEGIAIRSTLDGFVIPDGEEVSFDVTVVAQQ